MMDPTLAEMGNHLSDAMKILESGKLESEQGKERRKLSWKDIPGPLQGDRMQYVAEQGHMALLGHSLAAYISVLERERLRKLTTRILSDTTLWLCRLFRYENGSAYYHEDDCEGLVNVCRLVINTHYEDYATEGFTMLSSKHPVIYQSAACRPGLGQHLCCQLGLPLSCLCIVPCNTMFGSLHQMDVALLDKLIRDDRESGKVPLLLIANAGTPGAGHTDKLSRLKELCVQYNMWLHVEGVNLATLALGQVSSAPATKCDSMTLTPGPWLGLPAVPAVTLYRHEDPALSLAAGLTSSQPVEKLRALPLWLSLQYLGHDGIVQRIKHASQLVSTLPTSFWMPTSMHCTLNTRINLTLLGTDLFPCRVEDELNSPVVVFRFSQDSARKFSFLGCMCVCVYVTLDYKTSLKTLGYICSNSQKYILGEQLAQQVPLSGVDVVELEDEGTCVRFSPLMTAAALGTQENDVAALVEKLGEMIPVLSCTLRFRQDFKDEVLQQASLSYIEDLSWPGLGGVRYEPRTTDLDEDKRQHSVEKINGDLLKKLMELDTDLYFSGGPEFCEEKNGIFIGMATEDLDVAELVETIVSIGRDIEESGKLFENMTEVVRRGIQEAELQLQKANEEKLIEEGVFRQIPLVGSVLNWLSPVQASVKGRTFNLAEGQKLFRRQGAGSDSVSDTSSVNQLEESFREMAHVQASDAEEAEVPQEHHVHIVEETALSDQRVPEGQETESVDTLR
uniref:Pyridoxal-dependent decarboxylase domain-containing protein 1 n=1 Tax=Sinocyclocheilus grahami TaxID=75366 RepID=A0A672SRG3_SINGR